MREVTIPQNFTDLLQHRSKSGAPDNSDLKDNWFTPDLEEYPRENPNHDSSVPHVQESPTSKRSSVFEVIELTASKGF